METGGIKVHCNGLQLKWPDLNRYALRVLICSTVAARIGHHHVAPVAQVSESRPKLCLFRVG